MKFLRYLLPITFMILLVNCSGESEPDQQEENRNTSAANGAATTQTVEIIGIDNMKYVVEEKKSALQTGNAVSVEGETYYLLEGITTKADEELTIILTTISNLSAAAMSHNWLLLEQSANPADFARASMTASTNDYVAPDKMNLVIKETGLVAAGETATISFTTPEQADEYEYICTFPAHFTAGMRGILTVR